MRRREAKRQQRAHRWPLCMLFMILSLIALNFMLFESMREHEQVNRAKTKRSVRLQRMVWPTVFIIGSPKAGTTSLAAMLFHHPKFCAPKHAVGNKEVSFFNIRQNFEKGASFYLSFFGRDPKCMRYRDDFHEYVDATPTYLRSAGGAERMKQTIPRSLHGKCRFIVVLREPVSRHLAWFNHLGQANGFSEYKKFQHCAILRRGARKDKALECYREVVREDLRLHASSYNLQGGIYVQQLQAWLKSFDRNQTFVVNFDSLMSDSKATLAGLGKFLGADNTEWRKLNLPHLNAQHHLSKISLQDLDAQTCSMLKEFYETYNRQLYHLLWKVDRPIGEPQFQPFSNPCTL
mmetsp:Transcript_31529/g.100858  ORF Transcript_31529/g.100858 Transcript_31529/m.100858 type:complete len:348 (-) Transcript_31529:75-1118(-)